MRLDDDYMRMAQAQQGWMFHSVMFLCSLAASSLVLMLGNDQLPKAPLLLTFLMATTSAVIFEWERRVRKRKLESKTTKRRR